MRQVTPLGRVRRRICAGGGGERYTVVAGAKRNPIPSLRSTDRSHKTEAATPAAISVMVVTAQTGTYTGNPLIRVIRQFG